MHYLWLDLETTGLDPRVHSIVECAAILTDENLKELWRIEAVVNPGDCVWSPYCIDMHSHNGLGALVNAGDDLLDVEDDIVAQLSRSKREGDSTIKLAGNSPHFDRRFIREHMKSLNNFLHHRHFDISVLLGIAPTWFPGFETDKTMAPHRAMADIERALETARDMRDHFVSKGGEGF